jgi:hypothetical protein
MRGRDIRAALWRRGLGSHADPEEADPLLRDQPLLAELCAASVQGRVAIGPACGKLAQAGEDEDAPVSSSPRCAAVSPAQRAPAVPSKASLPQRGDARSVRAAGVCCKAGGLGFTPHV